MSKILVVDNEETARDQLEWAATQVEDREVILASDGKSAIQLIQDNDFDVIVTDLRMESKYEGLDVLKAAKAKDIYTQVIVVTAYGTPDISVQAMTLGAFDYIERIASGTDVLNMIASKIGLALEFREAKIKGATTHG